MKTYKAPVRIDLAGGWTDIPYLMGRTFGYVSNVAITLLDDSGKDCPVQLIDGKIEMNGFPRGVGISTSTSADMLKKIFEARGAEYVRGKTLNELAEELFELENQDFTWAIGRQDPYSIVYGGFNCFRFEEDGADVVPYDYGEGILAELEKRTLDIWASPTYFKTTLQLDSNTGTIFDEDGNPYKTVDFDETETGYIIRNTEGTVLESFYDDDILTDIELERKDIYKGWKYWNDKTLPEM